MDDLSQIEEQASKRNRFWSKVSEVSEDESSYVCIPGFSKLFGFWSAVDGSSDDGFPEGHQSDQIFLRSKRDSLAGDDCSLLVVVSRSRLLFTGGQSFEMDSPELEVFLISPILLKIFLLKQLSRVVAIDV